MPTFIRSTRSRRRVMRERRNEAREADFELKESIKSRQEPQGACPGRAVEIWPRSQEQGLTLDDGDQSTFPLSRLSTKRGRVVWRRNFGTPLR